MNVEDNDKLGKWLIKPFGEDTNSGKKRKRKKESNEYREKEGIQLRKGKFRDGKERKEEGEEDEPY